MSNQLGRVTGGRAVVDALVAAGVTHVFCVPGESYLGVLDALYDESRIRVVATRHEGGAAFMAEAFAKLTHRPAVCMGTRMVGGGNLAIGIHTARQDSSPVLALLGHVSTHARAREAFQEAELTQVFGPLAKWAVEPPNAERLAETVLRAARIATSGRPGPVVIALREDLLSGQVESLPATPLVVPRAGPDPSAIAETVRLLRTARRPTMLLGAGVLATDSTGLCVRLAEAELIPALASWRRPDVFPNGHPLYLGHTGLGAIPVVEERLRESDLVLAMGTRLSEYVSLGYSAPPAQNRLVHVDVAPEQLGGHRQADVACFSDVRLFLEALIPALAAAPLPPDLSAVRVAANVTDRAKYDAQTTPKHGRARSGFVDQQAVMAHLRTVVENDAIVTTDAGNFSGWGSRYLRREKPGTFLGPTSGAMGYGIPAAIAAKLARPDQSVLALVGDGGFLMTGTEVETAVRENTPFVGLVYDNAQYGTIRMHQMRDHPGREIATKLGPVDFAQFAESLGALGISVRDDAEFPTALADARASGRPAILHLRVDPEQISVMSDSL